jgi:hypothetical protein
MQALSGVVDICSAAFDRLSTAVPQPQLIPFGKGKVFRHAEQMLEQAIVQKLSRVISGLHAVKVLMEHGLYQEVAVLFRVLDELTEDIHFLCLPLFDQPRSALHDEYLQSFYQEDHQNPDDLTQPFKKRQTISRKRIHSALAEALPINKHDGMHIQNVLSTLYSGYVHAASPHIMDAYGGMPPHFHVSGMRGTPRQETFIRESTTYFYRSLQATMLVSLAFREIELADFLFNFREQFEQQVGMTSWKEPEKMMRDLKAKGKA